MRNIYYGKLFYFYLTPQSLLDPPPPSAFPIISPSRLLAPVYLPDCDPRDYTANLKRPPGNISDD